LEIQSFCYQELAKLFKDINSEVSYIYFQKSQIYSLKSSRTKKYILVGLIFTFLFIFGVFKILKRKNYSFI